MEVKQDQNELISREGARVARGRERVCDVLDNRRQTQYVLQILYMLVCVCAN
jgi:hypothetical protein